MTGSGCSLSAVAITLRAPAGSLPIALGSPRCLSASAFSCGVPTASADCNAGMACVRAKATSTSSASERPGKSRSPTARESRSKTVLLPPISRRPRAASCRSCESDERRCATSSACSVGEFTLASSEVSVVRSAESGDFSARTNGTNSALSGFASTSRANTPMRARWVWASDALPESTSSSLTRSCTAGASAATRKASISSGLFQEAALNWLSRSFPDSMVRRA